MKSVNASLRRLPRFSGSLLSVNEVLAFMDFPRPQSLFELCDQVDRLPEEKVFHADIVTSAALGGAVTLTLRKDGRYRFQGFMRATGFLSFDFQLTVLVRSADNKILVAAHRSGTVFGDDTPGDEQVDWDERDLDPERAKVVRNCWPRIHGGSLEVRRSSEVAGLVGGAIDLATDIAKIFVVAQTLGASLAICITIGQELGEIGAGVPGFGGVIGLGIVGGSLFIWGPLAIGPAILAGVAIGAVVDELVLIRRMTDVEIAFARKVFADSIDFEHVRLTNLLGLDNRPFVAPTVDGTILVNIGNLIADPTKMSTDNYPVPGQLLIHELTHVWQLQHRSLSDGFVPGWLCEALEAQAQGSAAYEPGAPGPDWHDFGIEAQASIVDRWFGGSPDGRKVDMKRAGRIQMDPANPYNRYVLNNVQLGLA